MNVNCNESNVSYRSLLIRVGNGNYFFLFLKQNIGFWYPKEPSQWNPKHMFKLMDKKRSQFYAQIIGLTGPIDYVSL